MYKIDEILFRIKQIEGINSNTELANILKVTPQNIYIWRKRNTIPYKELIGYCKNNLQSMDWLLTGKKLNQSLESAAKNISEPSVTYNDPRDKIIQRLQEENRQLKNTIDIIQTMINKSHNKC
jgi:DNA-binding transcriptional MerR regulator